MTIAIGVSLLPQVYAKMKSAALTADSSVRLMLPLRRSRVASRLMLSRGGPGPEKGAKIVCAPTAAFLPAGAAKRERAIAANAQVNRCFILRVNRISQDRRLGFYARSFAVDPGGEFVAEPSGPNEGMVLADLDRIADARSAGTFFQDRRPASTGADLTPCGRSWGRAPAPPGSRSG